MSGLTMLEGYKPSDFGLDEYAAYRTHPDTGAEVQLEVIEFAAYCEKRVAAASAPVGIGKMLIAMTLAKLTGMRTAIVVPFKGLQDQYSTTLARHLVDIRGRSNYTCGDYGHLNCQGGASMGCRYLYPGSGCTYTVQKDRAKEAGVFVTNYDYWLNINDHVGGLQRNKEDAQWLGENPVELLVLDEGDEAPEKVADYLGVKVRETDIRRWVDPRDMTDSVHQWQSMLTEFKVLEELKAELDTTRMEVAFHGRQVQKKHLDALHELERLLAKFERIAAIQHGEWVVDAQVGTRYGRQWSFDVVWPGRYVEQYLFCGIPKIVVMSGTLTYKDLAWMGVKKENFEYRQWAKIFPKHTQPTYICPAYKKNAEGKTVAVRIDRKSSDEDKRLWIEHIDRIIESRFDRKILIGTTSYEYQKFILSESRFASYMDYNDADPNSESAAEIAERFYEKSAPRILVSPSFGRGWDFSFDRAEVSIMSKLPFVPMFGKVMKAREERDKRYGDHVTMKKIEQFDGRNKRAPNDKGECFLVDGHFTYWLGKNKDLAQDWYVSSVRSVLEIPKAPKKLVWVPGVGGGEGEWQ